MKSYKYFIVVFLGILLIINKIYKVNDIFNLEKFEYKNKIAYKSGQNENIFLIDKIAPNIEGVKDLTVTEGTNIDLLSQVKVSDNSKETVKLQVIGEYNLKKTGTYNLKYVAIDNSGNVTESPFKLKVINKNNNKTGILITETSKEDPTAKEIIDNIEVNEKVNVSTKEKTNISNYRLNYNYNYVKETTDNYADNKEEIINIIYTALNSGANTFSFYCNYNLCKSDIEKMSKDGTLSYIQDFIHPYNILTKIYFQITDNYVTIRGTKKYSQSDIEQIENKVAYIIDNFINSNMNINEQVKVLHDYIINNTVYQNTGNISEQSAVGTLLNGASVCSGYTQAMAILLNRLNIPNYRLTVIGKHTWNFIFIDGKWLHLDATWDDPVDNSGSGKQYLRYDYFLINGNKLKELDKNESHNFNKIVYYEAINDL